ncbi:MAG TPA: hypothetical protein VGD78_11850 [Chthoniobacterales bacterium]
MAILTQRTLLPRTSPTVGGTLVFVTIAVWFNLMGWLLSAVHGLNAVGYALALVGLLALLYQMGRSQLITTDYLRAIRRWGRRVRRPLPALWSVMFILSLLGGLWYKPSNYDFLTYRFTRILHWWAQGAWHWIVSNDDRVNISAPGFEWVLTPFVVLTHSARGAALLNLASFVLMPGLLFVLLKRLGIRSRVAYQWMWLFPGGYCYVTQAGSAGNDAFAATYLLGGVVFALLGADRNRPFYLVASIFCAALLTGAKASNIPLVLPIIVACWPARRLMRRNWALMGAASVLACFASFVPIAYANLVFAGQWAGDAGGKSGLQIFNPVAGFVGNLAQLATNSVIPPIMPAASQWNSFEKAHLVHSAFGKWLTHNFPRLDLSVREIVSEEAAGLGLGIVVLWVVLLLRWLAALFVRAKPKTRTRPMTAFLGFFALACLFSFGVFLAKMGSEAGPRILATYYPVLLICVLLLVHRVHPRLRGAWLALCVVVQIVPVLLLLIQPARPFIPVNQIAHALLRSPGQAPLLQRINTVYSSYAMRADALGPMRTFLPAGVREVGFIANGNQPEVSLWEPLGSRRVVEVVDLEHEASLPASSVALVSWVEESTHRRYEEWMKAMHLAEAGRENLVLRVQAGPETWVVLNKADASGQGAVAGAPASP